MVLFTMRISSISIKFSRKTSNRCRHHNTFFFLRTHNVAANDCFAFNILSRYCGKRQKEIAGPFHLSLCVLCYHESNFSPSSSLTACTGCFSKNAGKANIDGGTFALCTAAGDNASEIASDKANYLLANILLYNKQQPHQQT